MAKRILIKPVISEKSELLTEKSEKYTFVVNKDANKLEIRQAVESYYSVNVTGVNTLVMPAKAKMRSTKRGYNTGRVSSFKKAIVTLAEGETIDIFGDI